MHYIQGYLVHCVVGSSGGIDQSLYNFSVAVEEGHIQGCSAILTTCKQDTKLLSIPTWTTCTCTMSEI